jgi:2-oxoglutarate dehydrogenase E1 component
VQEEPQNQGAWSYVAPRFAAAFAPLDYAGPEPMAAPATGIHDVHLRIQQAIFDDAFAH